jgi:tetratricopeptide (TPR) repeat protein
MAGKGKAQGHGSEPPAPGGGLDRLAEQSQIDFEVDFFRSVLERYPDYVDVLRVQGNNLTLKGRIRDGLELDKRLVRLRPTDALAHYNLACSFALLRQTDPALTALRRAIELGYRDFRYMRQDRDLDTIRSDPRYRAMLQEFENDPPAKQRKRRKA